MTTTKQITGKVIEITPINETPGRISEHNPCWCKALIKGDTVTTVKFPDSTDVAWYKYPKLQLNQTGTFEIDPDGVVIAVK